MVPLRPPARARLVTLLDIALIVSASAALVIVLGARTRFDVAGHSRHAAGRDQLILFAAVARRAAALARPWTLRACCRRWRVPVGRRFDAGTRPLARPAAPARAYWSMPARHAARLPGLDPAAHAASADGARCGRSPVLGVADRAAGAPARHDPRHLFDGNIFLSAAADADLLGLRRSCRDCSARRSCSPAPIRSSWRTR